MKRMDPAVVPMFAAFVITALLCALPVEGAVVTITAQGTVGSNGADQGAFGTFSTLAGKAFTLTATIDDTGGIPLSPNTSTSTSITNVHNATAVLTINGTSITIGTLPSNTFIAFKSTLPSFQSFSYDITGSGALSSAPSFNEEGVGISINSSSANAPFGNNPDWESPFTYVVQPSDIDGSSFTYIHSGAGTATGNLIVSSVTVTAAGAPPPASTVTPQVGLWWNPNESGTGYALDVKHGVLVVTVYSYTQSGLPLWYLVDGPIVNNSFSAPMTKYTNGQCISCSYQAPTMNGSDGTMTINFTSSTTATMTLPGRGTFNIVPQAF